MKTINEMMYEAGFGNVVSAPHIKGFEKFANLVLAEHVQRVGYFSHDAENEIWEEVTRADAPGATALYRVTVDGKDLHSESNGTTIDTEDLKKVEHALWIVEQHNRAQFGDSHNTVIEANKAGDIIRKALSDNLFCEDEGCPHHGTRHICINTVPTKE